MLKTPGVEVAEPFCTVIEPSGLVTVLVAGGCLLGLTALFFALRRRQPVLLMGWLWFVGILVPVIGLVQVGSQAMADRYTYLPQPTVSGVSPS